MESGSRARFTGYVVESAQLHASGSTNPAELHHPAVAKVGLWVRKGVDERVVTLLATVGVEARGGYALAEDDHARDHNAGENGRLLGRPQVSVDGRAEQVHEFIQRNGDQVRHPDDISADRRTEQVSRREHEPETPLLGKLGQAQPSRVISP